MLVSARQRQEPALPGTATPPGVIAPNAVSCRDPVGLRPRPYRATGCELQIGVVVNRCDHIRSNTAQLVVDVMQRRCILAPSLTPVEAWLRSWLTTGVILPNFSLGSIRPVRGTPDVAAVAKAARQRILGPV